MRRKIKPVEVDLSSFNAPQRPFECPLQGCVVDICIATVKPRDKSCPYSTVQYRYEYTTGRDDLSSPSRGRGPSIKRAQAGAGQGPARAGGISLLASQGRAGRLPRLPSSARLMQQRALEAARLEGCCRECERKLCRVDAWLAGDIIAAVRGGSRAGRRAAPYGTSSTGIVQYPTPLTSSSWPYPALLRVLAPTRPYQEALLVPVGTPLLVRRSLSAKDLESYILGKWKRNE